MKGGGRVVTGEAAANAAAAAAVAAAVGRPVTAPFRKVQAPSARLSLTGSRQSMTSRGGGGVASRPRPAAIGPPTPGMGGEQLRVMLPAPERDPQ